MDDDVRLSEGEERLGGWLREESGRGILVGFSGGVDSAYLACVAVAVLGPDRVLAVIGRSPSFSAEQRTIAHDVAERFAIPYVEIETRELADARYVANPSNRCYYCKTELWSRLAPLAAERGLLLVDGTNADDLADYRPGAAAGRERGVRSPLAECDLSKADIRALSRRRGLPTAALPASPCLASRLPYGTAVTADRLARVERAERALRDLGVVGDLRVRFQGDLARVELRPSELDRWMEPDAAERLRAAVVSAGFRRVAVDLRGFRSGSLNVLAGVGSGVGG
ncbi:MAG: ATP-dependent sacrificial sulfur transferase LarE [Gemmatirosa sp.]|nr:ATP-dependent sacrificial sulfur transferase LarE [Gemmatirosa sp.]